ncbi:hypothetical protein C0989_007080 [Termitomyces sp. Mn162]|nr:hypothetical protein C0989_007080 [Termitomyces sp. Mn162]
MFTGSGGVGVKAPIGKFNPTGTALPKDYVPPKHKVEFHDAKTVDYTDQHIIFTTIGPESDEQALANGLNAQSECLFQSGKQKRALLSIPNFPLPISKPPQIRHRISPSAHGNGMFATRNLAPNDLILAERPLLVISRAMQLGIPDAQITQLTPAQTMKAQLEEYEELLRFCIDRMSPENGTAFFKLHNCHTEDSSGPILGILRTNAIGFSVAGSDVKKEDKEFFSNVGIFAVASRMNHRFVKPVCPRANLEHAFVHSCTPNVSPHFHSPSFSLRLHATRSITAGEELFISYTDNCKPRAERQEDLRPYGFKCACGACSDPD